MASTITLSGDWLANIGNRMQTSGTGNLGTYATAGIAVTAAQVGLGTIISLTINPTTGYEFSYVPSTGKVKAFANGGAFTPSGTISAPTISLAGTHTTNTISVTAGGALAAADDASHTLITGVQAPTFTGSGGTVSAAEVSTGTDLSSVTFNFVAVGY